MFIDIEEMMPTSSYLNVRERFNVHSNIELAYVFVFQLGTDSTRASEMGHVMKWGIRCFPILAFVLTATYPSVSLGFQPWGIHVCISEFHKLAHTRLNCNNCTLFPLLRSCNNLHIAFLVLSKCCCSGKLKIISFVVIYSEN